MRVLQGGRVRAAATQPRWRLGWESRGNHVEGSASLGACPQTHLGTEGPLMCISRLQGKEVGVVGGVRTSPRPHFLPVPTGVRQGTGRVSCPNVKPCTPQHTPRCREA